MLAAELNWYWIVIVAVVVVSFFVLVFGDQNHDKKSKPAKAAFAVAEGIGEIVGFLVLASIGILVLLAYVLKW